MTDNVNPTRKKSLPYEVLVSKHNQRGAEEWCRENLGQRWEPTDTTGEWCCYWRGFPRPGQVGSRADFSYYFESEKSAILFALKWT